MKCPFCGEEMKEGFVSTVSRGAICWTGSEMSWGSATEDEEYIPLTDTNPVTATSIAAFCCDKCGKIIFDFKK